MKRKGHKPRDRWRPLVKCDTFTAESRETTITLYMRIGNLDRESATLAMNAYEADVTYWRNDLYQVATKPFGKDMLHINIRRIDGAAIRDWRHFQRIKNQLVGDECEAIELYPAESRLMDQCNKYHLFAVTDPTFRFPIGFTQRRNVQEPDPELQDRGGFKQRPL